MRPQRADVLIVGAGLAGARVAESLRAIGFGGRVLVVGDEPHSPYERPALSKALLLGTRTQAELALRGRDFWQAREIELQTGTVIDSIDVGARRAVGARGAIRWRWLVLATGLRPRRLAQLDGLANVHHLRTLDDAAHLRAALLPGARLAIIGAGFVGLEVATAALHLGAEVIVVEPARVPFERTLGPAVGVQMGAFARDAGVDLRLGTAIARPLQDGDRLVALELSDGSLVECDAALVGVGARPNNELVAGQLAIAPDGGVVTDAAGRTAAPAVYACGDAASVRGADGQSRRLEHWSAAAATARTVAHTIVGSPPPTPSAAYFWTDQFNRRLQVVGNAHPELAVDIQEGDGGFVARYSDRLGRLHAVALLDRPELLAEARSALAATLGQPAMTAA
jgi:3-phenylpropionate/trans-cinnamate dioxygenase ferredoxin reductase component